MKQYGIYIRQGSGTPYMIHIFDNLNNAKLKLFEMVGIEESRQRPYFVDNDFFDNKYNMVGNLKYFCIKERDVTDWEDYSEEKEIRKNNEKIIYLKNF